MLRDWPEHDARVDISIPQSGDGSAEGRIQVSLPGGVMLFDVRIPWEDYANAVLRSRGGAPGTVRIMAPELAGTEEERKTFPIAYRGAAGGPGADKAKAEVLRLYEHDGWRGTPGDLGNSHRRDENGHFLTTFRRRMLEGQPIEPVPSIPHAVLAAQMALRVLNDRMQGGDWQSKALEAIDLLDAGLRGADSLRDYLKRQEEDS